MFNGRLYGADYSVLNYKFQLPTATSMVTIVYYDFEVMDCNVCEIFLNLPLDHATQLASGMDITLYKSDLLKVHQEFRDIYPNFNRGDQTNDPRLIFVYNCSWMGYKHIPYGAICIYYHAEEFIVGDIKEASNAFRFKTVIMNIPRNDDFDLVLRMLYKYDTLHNCSASDMKLYVDDLTTIVATRKLT